MPKIKNTDTSDTGKIIDAHAGGLWDSAPSVAKDFLLRGLKKKTLDFSGSFGVAHIGELYTVKKLKTDVYKVRSLLKSGNPTYTFKVNPKKL